MDFERLQSMIEEMSSSNSTNDKLKVLKNYSDVTDTLWWVYNPYKQFHVTSANLKKKSGLVDLEYSQKYDFESILLNLSSGLISGHKAISAVNGFIAGHEEHQDLIYKIIDKNLEIRIDTKSINKVFPGLIPEFSVALANTFDEKMAKKIDFKKEEYLASRKLDGVRCIARKEGDDVKFFSRNGKEFWTLDKVKEDILEAFIDEDIVLDGEICLVDENGNEDFQNVMKEIRRKDHTIENPKYNIFDFLTLEEFDSKKSKRSFILRYNTYVTEFLNDRKHLTLVKQTPIRNAEHLVELTADAERKGWEGLILRKNAPYQGKRSNDLLKVKKFHDAEYVVEDVEMGPIRYINGEGVEVKEDMLSRIKIIHKGNTVGVGSGFSMDQRREFYSDPSKILGKTITVKFFQESRNQDGNYSLRFPTVKTIHGEEREV